MQFPFQQQQQDQQKQNEVFRTQVVYMAGKDVPKQFRILPAFGGPDETGHVDPATSWVPFVDENDVSTPWILGYFIWPNIGHGPWGRGGNRKSFIRFDYLFPDYGFDAVQCVVNAARNLKEWNYLFDRTPQQGGKTDSILRYYASGETLANVVIFSSSTSMPKTVVGSFSASLTRQLCGGNAGNDTMEEGLLNQTSGLDESYLAQDPMLRYRLGDVTDPNSGCVLEIYKDESTNPARYKVRPVKNEKNALVKVGVTPEMMAGRVDFSNPANMFNVPTPQAEVDRIATCLNSWSPDGRYHEYELLAEAFKNYPELVVPKPPARGAVNGFTKPAPLAADAPSTITYPVAPQQTPTPAYNYTNPAAQPAPAPVTTSPFKKQLAPAAARPAMPPAPQPAAVQPAAEPAPAPVVPGSPIAPFDRSEFMKRIGG